MKNNLIEILSNKFSRGITENKKFFVHSLIETLNANGYTVEKEVRYPSTGERINFKITDQSGAVCWIELDNKTPRLRSVKRIIELTKAGEDGFILLRNSFLKNHKFLDIDIICARR